jgi:hypothetical protein
MIGVAAKAWARLMPATRAVMKVEVRILTNIGGRTRDCLSWRVSLMKVESLRERERERCLDFGWNDEQKAEENEDSELVF